MLTERDRKVLNFIEKYKSISINQASNIFFNTSYEGARRRLKQLEEMKYIKSYILKDTKEKAYYMNKKLSKHDLLVNDFIGEIKKRGGDIIQFITQPTYLNKKIRPDAFIIFSLKEMVYFILLEVDLHHYTSNIKMKVYEELYKSGELEKECYGTFPIILIARPTKGIRYNSRNFNVVYTDLSYSTIDRLLLLQNTIIS